MGTILPVSSTFSNSLLCPNPGEPVSAAAGIDTPVDIAGYANDPNGRITYTAAIDFVRIEQLGGTSQSFGVTVSGNDVIVQLATTSAGVPTSTATTVAAGVNAVASALLTAVAQGTGAGIAGISGFVPLSYSAVGSVRPGFQTLINDVQWLYDNLSPNLNSAIVLANEPLHPKIRIQECDTATIRVEGIPPFYTLYGAAVGTPVAIGTGNGQMIFTAKQPYLYVFIPNPNVPNLSLSATFTDGVLNISLGTDGSSNINTTANDLVTYLNTLGSVGAAMTYVAGGLGTGFVSTVLPDMYLPYSYPPLFVPPQDAPINVTSANAIGSLTAHTWYYVYANTFPPRIPVAYTDAPTLDLLFRSTAGYGDKYMFCFFTDGSSLINPFTKVGRHYNLVNGALVQNGVTLNVTTPTLYQLNSATLPGLPTTATQALVRFEFANSGGSSEYAFWGATLSATNSVLIDPGLRLSVTTLVAINNQQTGFPFQQRFYAFSSGGTVTMYATVEGWVE